MNPAPFHTKVSIVMPSLNEEEAIRKTIDEIPFEELKRQGYKIEVIVVDGGSSDKTVKIAQDRGAKVITSDRGYGRQYRVGFKNASGEIIVTADSDGSYPMKKISNLLKILKEENLDFITINRFSDMSSGAMRKINRIGNILLTAATNMLFPIRIKDSQSGMWIFRREILNRLNLISDGMSLSEEIKIEAFATVKSKEIPGSYKKRVGQVKLRTFRDGWDNLLFLLKKRIKG